MKITFKALDNSNKTYSCGKYSYGIPNIYSWGESSKLEIGNFCSIAMNTFIGLPIPNRKALN